MYLGGNFLFVRCLVKSGLQESGYHHGACNSNTEERASRNRECLLPTQGRKSPCDRKVAQIKCHIKAYINQGNSVNTPEELKAAVESDGGIAGVLVACIPGPTKETWEGISSYYNFTLGLYASKVETMTIQHQCNSHVLFENYFSVLSSLLIPHVSRN